MAMAVVITNVTDAPESKKTPMRLAIYTAHLDPGESLKLPATHVDARLRKLEKDGYIAIGQLPSWYNASKAKKLGRRPVTATQIKEKFSKKKPAGKKGELAAPAPEAPKPHVNSVPAVHAESIFKKKKDKEKLETPVVDSQEKDKKNTET